MPARLGCAVAASLELYTYRVRAAIRSRYGSATAFGLESIIAARAFMALVYPRQHIHVWFYRVFGAAGVILPP